MGRLSVAPPPATQIDGGLRPRPSVLSVFPALAFYVRLVRGRSQRGLLPRGRRAGRQRGFTDANEVRVAMIEVRGPVISDLRTAKLKLRCTFLPRTRDDARLAELVATAQMHRGKQGPSHDCLGTRNSAMGSPDRTRTIPTATRAAQLRAPDRVRLVISAVPQLINSCTTGRARPGTSDEIAYRRRTCSARVTDPCNPRKFPQIASNMQLRPGTLLPPLASSRRCSDG